MAKTKSRKPDYDLSALDKSTGERGKVGGAWVNDDGTINIKLNHCIVLTAGPDLHLTLFPYGDGTKPKKANIDYLGLNDHET